MVGLSDRNCRSLMHTNINKPHKHLPASSLFPNAARSRLAYSNVNCHNFESHEWKKTPRRKSLLNFNEKSFLIMTFHIRRGFSIIWISRGTFQLELEASKHALGEKGIVNLRKLKPIKFLMMLHISRLSPRVICFRGRRRINVGNENFRDSRWCSCVYLFLRKYAFHVYFFSTVNKKIFIFASANRLVLGWWRKIITFDA